MMRLTSLLVAGLLATAGSAAAHTTSKGRVQVIHPWIQPAGNGEDTSVHPTIANDGSRPVEIVGVAAPVADAVQMHLDNKPVETVTIAPGETLTPDRLRITLEDLKQALPGGKGTRLSLRFEAMKPMRITAAIGRSTKEPETLVGPDR